MYILGLDVGGTKIEAALIKISQEKTDLPVATKNGDISYLEILARKRIPTEREKGYPIVIEKMAQLCKETCEVAKVPLSSLSGIGIGLPGTVHPETHVMLNGNTSILVEKDIAGELKARLDFNNPIYCENDANCFALAEAFCGAGLVYQKETKKPVNEQIGIGIILGTGVGGGVIINGKPLIGRQGGGAELGHSTLVIHGHPCYCGRNGCVEQYLSGPALEALYASRIYTQIKARPTAMEIFEMAKTREPFAMAVIQQYKKDLVNFLLNLTNIFDPDYFVLGGGVSKQEFLYKETRKLIGRTSFVPNSQPQVYQYVLGDSAGVIGAALLNKI